MTRQKELAMEIEKGLLAENVQESENCFFEDVFGKYHVCALGAALVGKFGSAERAYSEMEAAREIHIELTDKDLVLSPDYVDVAANLLDIDFDLAEAIDRTHMFGVPATAIAQKLRIGTFPY